AHNDATYGHQNGELNFWVPLTDRKLTQVDLHCESVVDEGDYHAIAAKPGEIIAFHGSSCRHYINANTTPHTRVSMDFRVGVEGYFDPTWAMVGTSDDHTRSQVSL
ncbi:strG, partial [Symbiodinium sp. CCMP2456]